MSPFRIALANIRYPASREESVTLAEQAIGQAATAGARLVCFPECFVPGYRAADKPVLPPAPDFLDQVWATLARAGRYHGRPRD